MRMNKKGDIFSILIVIVVFLVIGIVVYFGGLISNNIFYELGDSDTITASEGQNAIQQRKDNSIALSDNIILFILVGFLLSLLIAGLYMEFDPVMVIIFILILFFAVYGAMAGSNLFDGLTSQTQADIQGGDSFTFTNALTGRAFPVVIFIVGVLIVIIMYSRRGVGGQF